MVLAGEEVWKPGEPANHVTVCWNVSDKLSDAAEAQGSDGRADHVCGAADALEQWLADALSLVMRRKYLAAHDNG
ncbi:hypothetical protein [Streptomyces coeruleofuscus]|uniref:Uncharacterized protein n=1 Tax=Streptomyces coeruleofuscus TaxID=66879 RepID=A0ABN3JE19_9ACTN